MHRDVEFNIESIVRIHAMKILMILITSSMTKLWWTMVVNSCPLFMSSRTVAGVNYATLSDETIVLGIVLLTC